MEHKFKVGDRVRVVKIDDKAYYNGATYQVGDVGCVTYCGDCYKGHYYWVEFDRLKMLSEYNTWSALEDWLVEVKSLITYE